MNILTRISNYFTSPAPHVVAQILNISDRSVHQDEILSGKDELVAFAKDLIENHESKYPIPKFESESPDNCVKYHKNGVMKSIENSTSGIKRSFYENGNIENEYTDTVGKNYDENGQIVDLQIKDFDLKITIYPNGAIHEIELGNPSYLKEFAVRHIKFFESGDVDYISKATRSETLPSDGAKYKKYIAVRETSACFFPNNKPKAVHRRERTERVLDDRGTTQTNAATRTYKEFSSSGLLEFDSVPSLKCKDPVSQYGGKKYTDNYSYMEDTNYQGNYGYVASDFVSYKKFANGVLREELNREKHTIRTEYDSAGRKERIVSYSGDSADGRRYNIQTFRDGNLSSEHCEQFWTKSCTPERMGNYFYGPYKTYYPNGNFHIVGQLRDGLLYPQLNGECLIYHPNGTLHIKCVRNDTYDTDKHWDRAYNCIIFAGPYEEYYDNGQIKIKGTRRDILMPGVKFYPKQPRMVFVGEYEEFYKNGNVRLKCTFSESNGNYSEKIMNVAELTEVLPDEYYSIEHNYPEYSAAGRPIGGYEEYSENGNIIKAGEYLPDGRFVSRLESEKIMRAKERALINAFGRNAGK
jgi:hypothetical protein